MFVTQAVSGYTSQLLHLLDNLSGSWRQDVLVSIDEEHRASLRLSLRVLMLMFSIPFDPSLMGEA